MLKKWTKTTIDFYQATRKFYEFSVAHEHFNKHSNVSKFRGLIKSTFTGLAHSDSQPFLIITNLLTTKAYLRNSLLQLCNFYAFTWTTIDN